MVSRISMRYSRVITSFSRGRVGSTLLVVHVLVDYVSGKFESLLLDSQFLVCCLIFVGSEFVAYKEKRQKLASTMKATHSVRSTIDRSIRRRLQI